MTTISVSGLIATTPRHIITQDGLPITSFRLASTVDRYDGNGNIVQGETNWFTITAFHSLALNASSSLSKGDRITLTGNLRVRDWDNGERAGTSVEIEASSIGHDLAWGTSEFTRTVLVREDREVANSQEPTNSGHSCNCRRCTVRSN